jgi:HEAT repeat protein
MDPATPLPVEEVIAHLAIADEPLLNTELAELSGLNQAELKLLENSFAKFTAERRRQIIHRLAELAEDNLELNFDAIFKLSLKDPDAEIRSTAIEGLWENEETSLISPFIGLLEQDSSEQVQAAAAAALGKFATLAEHNKLRPTHLARISQMLLAAINDKNKAVEVRHRALEAAAPLSLPEVKQSITDAYHSLDPRLRASAIYSMGKSLDPDWLPILLKELTSPDAELRYEACGACGELEEATAVPGLVRLVDDSDTDVRMAAILALGKIDTIQARECLKKCLKSQDEAVRQTAEQALNELEVREDPLSFQL